MSLVGARAERTLWDTACVCLMSLRGLEPAWSPRAVPRPGDRRVRALGRPRSLSIRPVSRPAWALVTLLPWLEVSTPLAALRLCALGHRRGPVRYPICEVPPGVFRNLEHRLERGQRAASFRHIQGHPAGHPVGSHHPLAAPPDLVPLVAKQRTQVQTPHCAAMLLGGCCQPSREVTTSEASGPAGRDLGRAPPCPPPGPPAGAELALPLRTLPSRPRAPGGCGRRGPEGERLGVCRPLSPSHHSAPSP